jgi:urea transporter
LTAVNLANALFRGVGEVFLQGHLWIGVVFVIAILVSTSSLVRLRTPELTRAE